MSATRTRTLISVALLLFGKHASAQYAVVSNSAHPQVLAQRVVVSLSDPPEVWLALHLAGGTGTGALVLAAARNTDVRPADNAWFSALEVATAVRVLAPEGADSPECPVSGPAWDDTREAWPAPSATLSTIDRFESEKTFAAYCEERGFVLETSLLSQFENIAPEGEIVALGFSCAPNDSAGCVISAHFEIRSQSELMVPLLGSEEGVATTVWALSGSPLSIQDVRTASLSAVSPVVWYAASARSDYTTARSTLLSADHEMWLLESASSRTFGSGIVFDDARRIPSVVTSYEPGDFDELATLSQPPEWIMRWFGYATPTLAGFALRDSAQPSVWPIHRWAKLDATGCVWSPPSSDPAPGGNGTSGTICNLCTPEPDREQPQVASGCSSSSTSSGDGCTGDTSQSSDSSCSSDTSDSSDSGCSSDSSGSEGGDCSGDSAGSDSGCSGDTAGSSSGCSGDAASAARPVHAPVARARRWRGGPMISTYMTCALMLPLRRLRRRR